MEFVVRAHQGKEKLSRLCAEFGISRPTGYVWLKRYREQGVAGIEEHSASVPGIRRARPPRRSSSASPSCGASGPMGERAN